MYSYGSFHMDEQRQDDQLEPTHNSSVPIQDVTLKTYLKRLTIETGRWRVSGIFLPMARHDDDDDDASSQLTNLPAIPQHVLTIMTLDPLHTNNAFANVWYIWKA